MDIFRVFATDPAKELEGVWFPIGPAEKTLPDGKPDPDSVPQLLIARNGNKKHSRIVTKMVEANKTTLEMKGDPSEERGVEITVEAMAESVLLGWKNIEFDGVKLPDTYSVETARKMLAVKEFRELVNRFASDYTKYRVHQDEADKGNS